MNEDLNESPYQGLFKYTLSDGGSIPASNPFFIIMTVFDREQWVKIQSSAIEGAETIYPFEYNEIVDPIMRGAFMSCEQVANCLLENVDFLNGITEWILNDPALMQSIGNQLTQKQLIESNVNQSDNELTKDLEQTTTSLDVVWGGCRETIEYMIDIVKTICFFLDGLSNLQDVVTQIYSKDKNKRYNFEAQDALNNPINVRNDGEVVNQNGEWTFVPNILGQLVYTIGQSTMLALLTEIAGLGASLVLADITDTREEALTCIMFNTITCDGSNQKPPPYTFDNDVFYRTCNAMLGNLDAGLVGQAIGFLGTVAGGINSFVSAIPLDEVHRNFRIGMRNPSDEWAEICDTCQQPTNWSYTFDFTASPHTNFWEGVPISASGWSNPEITGWEAGLGWGNGRALSNLNNQSEMARIKGVFTTQSITSISVSMFFVSGQNGAFANQLVLGTTNTNSIYVKAMANTGGLKVEPRALSNITTNEFYVQVRGYSRTGNNNPQGETWIRSITFTGTGINPFI